jgi:predicted nucleotidyltransferase component of viral defense system
MKKKPTNTAASVRAKLLNVANASKRAFDTVLLQYFQERFLFRLAQSQHRAKLILKGALMFRAYGIPLTRPTKDIDLLGRNVGPEADIFVTIIQEIIKVDCEDGVVFDRRSIVISRIKEDADYEGLRVFVEGTLDSARKKLQIDIGFGDLITEGPREMDYPVILDQPAPHLLVYSRETAIAEKFEAIVRLGGANSRMKDFYDILYLAEHEEFDAQILSTAITKTFSHRGTDLNQAEFIFSEEFKSNRTLNEMWTAFLKRSGLDTTILLPTVIGILQDFLNVAFEPDDRGTWSPNMKIWQPRNS